MFLHVSVILFTGQGSDTHPPDRHPPGRHPPGQTPPPRQTPPLRSACWDTVNKRAVRILLECNLVHGAYTGYFQFKTWWTLVSSFREPKQRSSQGVYYQWRIQDLPGVCQPLGGCADLLFWKKFPKMK